MSSVRSCSSGHSYVASVNVIPCRAPSGGVQPASSRQSQRGRRSRGGKDTAGLSPHSSTESMEGCDPCMLFLLFVALYPALPLTPHPPPTPTSSVLAFVVFFLPSGSVKLQHQLIVLVDSKSQSETYTQDFMASLRMMT